MKKWLYPELQYMDVNEYGKNVVKRADPYFPAYYFIIGLRNGFPKHPKPKFPKFEFPTYRSDDSVNWQSIRDYFRGKNGKEFFNRLIDFQLLIFLALKLDEHNEFLIRLYQIARGDTLSESETTRALEALLHEHDPTNTPPRNNTPTQTHNNNSNSNNSKKEEMITKILEFGFTRQQAEEAITVTQQTSVENALNFLLS